MKKTALRTLIAPLAIGRDAVRATRASKLRSAMSFRVQPAPRMIAAPRANRRRNQGSGQPGLASAVLHQQGNISSQMPIGRSTRASRRYGRAVAGA